MSKQVTQQKTKKPLGTNDLLTGESYLESLDDGREVWFDGEKISNVVEHPAYRNSARSMARLYDQLHDPELKDDLLLVDKFGITTHKFFAPSYNTQELLAARDAIAIWQRTNYGWMGRSPDYKAAFMAQLSECHDYYQPFGDNALNWYRKSASQCLFMNHVLIDPPVDRNRARIDVRDVYLSVDKRMTIKAFMSVERRWLLPVPRSPMPLLWLLTAALRHAWKRIVMKTWRWYLLWK